MKLNTLEKLYRCMQERSPRIELDPRVRARALAPIQRMLSMS
jgi:quinolinate synthase